MNEICKKEICTGCQACRLVCPVSAISMQPDAKGFLHPEIDQNLCINCEKCQKVCPSLKEVQPINENTQRVYAAWSKDSHRRDFSTSGGVFAELATYVLEQKGVVFGVIWKKYGAKHISIENASSLYKIQGSKYTQSDVGDSYKEAKNFLSQKRMVLFSGTPCQIAALKSYLSKEYTNLFTVDIVCHGVPSKTILLNRIHDIEIEKQDTIENVRFRDKKKSQFNTYMKYDFKKSKDSLKVSVYKDPYYRGFVMNYFLRESCYSCSYANTDRVGDITLADFWCYSPKKIKYLSYRKGTSLVISNNHKGETLFSRIKKRLVVDESTLSAAKYGNRNLSSPQIKPALFSEFWKEYTKNPSLDFLSRKFFPTLKYKPLPILYKIKFVLTLLLPKKLIEYLRKIKNSL